MSGDYADLRDGLTKLETLMTETRDDVKEMKEDAKTRVEMCYEHQHDIAMLKHNQSLAIKILGFFGGILSCVVVAWLTKILGLI